MVKLIFSKFIFLIVFISNTINFFIISTHDYNYNQTLVSSYHSSLPPYSHPLSGHQHHLRRYSCWLIITNSNHNSIKMGIRIPCWTWGLLAWILYCSCHCPDLKKARVFRSVWKTGQNSRQQKAGVQLKFCCWSECFGLCDIPQERRRCIGNSRY